VNPPRGKPAGGSCKRSRLGENEAVTVLPHIAARQSSTAGVRQAHKAADTSQTA